MAEVGFLFQLPACKWQTITPEWNKLPLILRERLVTASLNSGCFHHEKDVHLHIASRKGKT